MSGTGEIISLLTQEPVDIKKIAAYGRSKKLDVNDLLSIALGYSDVISEMRHLAGILTPFHVACCRSKAETVAALLEEGCCVNYYDKRVDTYLESALIAGNIPVARLLLQRGAETSGGGFRISAMEAAFKIVIGEKKCLNAMKLLVEFGVSVNLPVNKETQATPLHLAAKRNIPAVISFLLQKGADGNALDADKSSPLHIACFHNNVEVAKLLILHEVDMYKENINGEIPLETAIKKNPYNKDVINALLKGGCDINKKLRNGISTPLHCALLEPNLDQIKFLVSVGANPNKSLKAVGNALHFIAGRKKVTNVLLERKYAKESLDIVKFLVNNGANVDAVISNSKYSPLEIALKSRFFDLAKLLIKLGADVNKDSSSGESIFFHAAGHNNDIITLFLEYGADYKSSCVCAIPYHNALKAVVDVKYIKEFVKFGCPFDHLMFWDQLLLPDSFYKFFLAQERFFCGLKENNLKMVKEAVENGAVPTGCSTRCTFPLHFLARKGYSSLVLYLLNNSFPANVLDFHGQPALFIAAKLGHYDICCKLLQFGACYNYRSKKCPKTPQMIALEFNHRPIVNLFKRVDKMFYLVRFGYEKFNKGLMEVVAKSPGEIPMFLNANNIHGETLMSTAFRFNQLKNARKIMGLRVSFCHLLKELDQQWSFEGCIQAREEVE